MTALRVKALRTRTSEDQKLAACDKICRNREPKWKFRAKPKHKALGALSQEDQDVAADLTILPELEEARSIIQSEDNK